MPLFRRPPQRRARVAQALTAATQTVNARTADSLRRLSQQWQVRALEKYDVVPECWYPAQGYARSMGRIRFFPAIRDEKGDAKEVEAGPLVDLFQRIQDPGGGGMSELASAYGRLQFLIGDGYLTVTKQDGEEAWEYLSPLELRTVPASSPLEFLRLRAPGMAQEDLVDVGDEDFEPLGNSARVWRLWRRHPTFTSWADSPVNACLDLYELLQRLTLAADAQANNRGANRGLLIVPEELDFGSGDTLEPDEDPKTDPFLDLLLASLQAALKNPGSAAAASPIVVRAKGALTIDGATYPTADLIKWLPMGPDDHYQEAEMWARTIDRIANGLDLPVALVTGDVGAVNHWGGWLVDEQGFRMHVAPVADRFARDLNAAYLRPAAIADEIPDAENVCIGYDPAAAINHPDEIKTARDAYRDGVVGADYYRDKIGATDTDAPTEEDLGIIFGIQRATLPGEEPAGATAPQDGGRGGDVNEEAPAQNGNGNGAQPDAVNASALQAAHVLGALNLTVHRARELAGSRLRTKSQGCAECRDLIADVPAASVASAMGSDTVHELMDGHGELAQLVAGASAGFAVTATRYGLPADIALELGRLGEQHGLRTLFEAEAPPLPAGVHAVVAKAIR